MTGHLPGGYPPAPVRIPGSAVRWWLWMPMTALLVATFATFTPPMQGLLYDHWYQGWGLIAAAGTAATLLGGGAGLVPRRRPVGPGAAATAGALVAVMSLFTFGALFVAGRSVAESLGWHERTPGDLAGQYVQFTLGFGLYGLLLTWWYALPAGAFGGWLAWQSAARRVSRRR